jgi:hypothetical protein
VVSNIFRHDGAVLTKDGAKNQIDGAKNQIDGAKNRIDGAILTPRRCESYNFMTLLKYVLKTKQLYYN